MSKSFRFWLVHPLVDFKMLSKYDGIPVYVGLGPDNNAKICGYFVDLQCPLPTQTNVRTCGMFKVHLYSLWTNDKNEVMENTSFTFISQNLYMQERCSRVI